jgi:hypothetical protein
LIEINLEKISYLRAIEEEFKIPIVEMIDEYNKKGK